MKKPIKADIRIPLCRIGIYITILALLLSCNGPKKALEKNLERANPDFALTLLLQDDYSGSPTAETLIITDAKELQQFFLKVNRTRKPGLPLPDVDFSRETVLIFCNGEKNHQVQPKLSIKDVTEKEIVIAPILEGKQKKSTSNAITSPFSIYKIPSTQKKIIFQKNR
jgi:hypothetical protein